MAAEPASIGRWLQLIEGEFREMPGLQLTKPQFRRLWGLDGKTCDALLDALVHSHFLKRTANGSYARADVVRWHRDELEDL